MDHYTDWPEYPTALLDLTDYPTQTDDVDEVNAWLINALVHEMISTQKELGTLPKGSYADVKARLDNLKLAANKTVNLNNSMSAATIQALIDAEPRYIPYGKTLTFQFADGTYTLSAQLIFSGFYGGGVLYIYGNTGESGQHTNQAVYLNFSGSSVHGLHIIACQLYAGPYIKNLKIATATASGHYMPIYVNSSFAITVEYCYILGNSTSNGTGIYCTDYSSIYARYNYVSNVKYGVAALLNGKLYSYYNDDTGTMPLYGMRATTNGDIGRTGNFIDGSTADELEQNSGRIRP